MVFRDSVAIISTKKDNVVNSYLISTRNYEKVYPHMFSYKDGYRCESFRLYEKNVDGSIIIETNETLGWSKVKVTNKITIANVTSIDILTSHETLKEEKYESDTNTNKRTVCESRTRSATRSNAECV